MHRLRAIALCCALAMLAGVAHAQDRNDAERRLQGVRSELKQVAAERRKLEGERGDASRKLREADEQVGGVQRSLQKTQATLQRDGADPVADAARKKERASAGLAAIEALFD